MQQNRRPQYRGRTQQESWLARQLRRRPKPLWMVLLSHVLVLGIALVLYALPHHVLKRQDVAIGTTSTRGGTVAAMAQTEAPTAEPVIEATAEPETIDAATPAPTAVPTPEPTPVPTPEADPVGVFRTKFADHFTMGQVERTSTSYRSANVDVSLTQSYVGSTRFLVADIYVADIACLKTAFGQDTYGRSYTEWPADIAKRYGALVTINGDYYGARDGGIVIRNGTLYRDGKNTADVCVLYWDGTMKVFSPWEFDADTEMANGAYQSWNFGPGLLNGFGDPLDSFNTSVGPANPRSVIGYFEPGHYCFVAIDGRDGNSQGLTMTDTARLMQYLGCLQAYNLDGGNSSVMCAGSTVVNNPSGGGRRVSDVIMITDGAG